MRKNGKKRGIVCTRYAPSPTGQLHVGGARTALFNYLYAKKNNGKFILRIEDTDRSRNVPDGHLEIENSLKLLNIFPDESFSSPGASGPYLQSQKLAKYREVCRRLLEEGKAYRCFCSDRELEEARQRALAAGETPKYSGRCRHLDPQKSEKMAAEGMPFAVRLRVDGEVRYEWDDLIRGRISTPSDSMGDYIIMRSNELPTYNFAVVIDDLDMKITCVLRGEGHIPNTPYQIATYMALGAEESIPDFGHLSIIVDEDRKKMSKRSGDECHFVSRLIEKGYLPEAVVNFLALLGWSHGETEIFTMEELVRHFDLGGISRAPAFFDIEKLNWLNHKYIQNMNAESYLNYLIPIFTADLGEHRDRKRAFALANQNNIHYGEQLNKMALDFFRHREYTDEMEAIVREGRALIAMAIEHFPEETEEWNNSTVRGYLKQLSQVSGLRGREFFRPLRVAFSLQMEGFELVNVLECLGRKLTLQNLERAREIAENE